MTFRDVDRATENAAAVLADHGVQAGDHVMLFGANSIEWVVAFWAVIRVGAVVVTGNAWWSRAQAVGAVELAAPSLILVDGRRRGLLADSCATLDFDSILSPVRSGAFMPPGLDHAEDDPAVIVFTSGTTGPPKGAVLSHRSLIASIHNLIAASGGPQPGARVRVNLVSVPLFHIGAIQQILLSLVFGHELVFLAGRFDAGQVLELIEHRGVSSWSAVPTMVSRVLHELERSTTGAHHTDSLRLLTMGAGPVPAGLNERIARSIPSVTRGVSSSYGLTEAGGAVAAGRASELTGRRGAVGRCFPTVDVRIGSAAHPNEILLRSPSLMLRYCGDVGQPVDGDRWLHTGDLGCIDPDGFLCVNGRLKDIIIRAGENVLATRIERRLEEHPRVREAAVFGVPHADLGEAVAAAVVLEGHVTEHELADHVRNALAYFEVPSEWLVLSELPRTDTGKIAKHKLAQMYATVSR